jgi:hypothetical protein
VVIILECNLSDMILIVTNISHFLSPLVDFLFLHIYIVNTFKNT